MYSFSVYDLRNIIHESMKDMLVDNNGRYEVWYRGYNSKYGSKRGELYWLTDDISYARAYGNRVEEVIIDMNKLNLASIYDCDGVLGYEIDYFDGPDEDGIKELLSNGYGGYSFEANSNSSDCICLWDLSCIVSARELSREEFNNIELYDDFDNPGYDDLY